MDIDKIFEEKGEEYANWTKITKQKLKDRERESMFVRVTTLQNVINAQCEHFEKINSKLNTNNNNIVISVQSNYKSITLNNNILRDCLNKLYLLVSSWTGAEVEKSRRSLTTFRKYFGVGKCWFDYRKQSLIDTEFWIKYFLLLETFAINSASIYFREHKELQTLYSKHLLFQILLGIFSTEIQFQSTKPQPIIPSRIIKDSMSMKIYLNNLHHTLNIDQIITQNETKLNAKQLINAVNKQLQYLTKKFHNEFKIKFNQTFQKPKRLQTIIPNRLINVFAELPTDHAQKQDKKQETQQEQEDDNSPFHNSLLSSSPFNNSPFHNSTFNNSTFNNSPLILPIPISETSDHFDINNNFNFNYNYNNNHSPSQTSTVFSQRYNPLNAYDNNNNNNNNNHCFYCCQSCNYCCCCCKSGVLSHN